MFDASSRFYLVRQVLAGLILVLFSASTLPASPKEPFVDHIKSVFRHEDIREKLSSYATAGFKPAENGYVYTAGNKGHAAFYLENDYSAGYSVVSQDSRIKVKPLKADKKSQLVVESGAAVFRNAHRNTDVVYLPLKDGLEELYVVSSRGGPHILREIFHGGRGLFLSPQGDLHINNMLLSRPVIYDSAGKKTEGRFEVAEEKGGSSVIRIAYDDRGLVYPVLIDPEWKRRSVFAGSFRYPKTILLDDGNLLNLYGELGVYMVPPTWEAINPLTGALVASGAMPNVRTDEFSVVKLASGKVLISGGAVKNESTTIISRISSSEVFDPATYTWSQAAEMNYPKAGHTLTLLRNGMVLAAGGVDADASAENNCELYNPYTNVWTVTGALATARKFHTATLLPDGNVLVAGGQSDAGTNLNNSEVYAVATANWPSGKRKTMNNARSNHTANLLLNGKVIVVGGGTAASELYDPAIDTWEASGSVAYNFPSHNSLLLPDGKVLKTGGRRVSGFLSLAGVITNESYDPNTGSWSVVEESNSGRWEHSNIIMPDGNAAVTRGFSAFVLIVPLGATNEVRVASTGTWPAQAVITGSRYGHSSTLLPDGRVLVVGGQSGSSTYISTSRIFYPSSNTWESVTSYPLSTAYHTAVLLPGGQVLVSGGRNNTNYHDQSYLFNPDTNVWTQVPSMEGSRAYHAATLLSDGRVLVTGGYNGTAYLNEHMAEIFDPLTNTWSDAAAFTGTRAYHTAVLLSDGRVMISGGFSLVGYINQSMIYDPEADIWEDESFFSDSLGRSHHTATLLSDGRVLVAGGRYGSTDYHATAQIFDPSTNSWTSGGAFTTARYDHTATLLPGGKVLIAGGRSTGTSFNSCQLYDPFSNSWIAGISLPKGLRNHTATLLPGGDILVVGGVDWFGVVSNAVYKASYLEYNYKHSKQPVISTGPSELAAGGEYTITGSNFKGAGNSFPRIYLQRLGGGAASKGDEGGEMLDLTSTAYPMTAGQWQSADTQLSFSVPFDLSQGHYLLSVNSGGMPSDAKIVSYFEESGLKEWTGLGSTESWSDRFNWSGAATPATDEAVYFLSRSTKNCVIDIPVTVEGISIGSGYTGTIEQTALLRVTGNFTQEGGTFLSSTPESCPFSVGASFTLSNEGTAAVFKRFAGDGTAVSPFMVRDIYDLQAMNCYKSASFEMANNIDASPTENWNWNGSVWEGFVPVGSFESGKRFTGSFNGDNKTVSGLFISREAQDCTGLFGFADAGAAIADVGMTGVTIKGRQYVGGLAGLLQGSSVTGSYATGNVSGFSQVGGLVGNNSFASVIERSFADCSVSGTANIIGGLAGNNSGSEALPSRISYSYAKGNVEGFSYIGGLAGLNNEYCQIENSYATGAVNGNNNVGGLAGSNSSGIIINCYATGNALGAISAGGLVGSDIIPGSFITNSYYSGSPDNGSGTRVSFEELQQKLTFPGWDFRDTWLIDEGKNPPYFTYEAWNSPPSSWTGTTWRKNHVVMMGTYPQSQDDMVYIGTGESVTVPSGINTLGGLHLGTGAVAVTIEASLTLTGAGTREGTLAVHGGFVDIKNDLLMHGDYLQTGGRAISDHTKGFTAEGSFSIPLISDAFKRFSGSGTAGSPYMITDVYGLQAMNGYKSSSFKLANNIDASPTENWNWNGSVWEGFYPVAGSFEGQSFSGSFYGDHKEIRGLLISREAFSFVGLFGRAETSEISNVGMEEVNIRGSEFVGGLAGSFEGTMINCYSAGIVDGRKKVGGLVGYNSGSSVISACYAVGTVSSTSQGGSGLRQDLGGLVGVNQSSITNSYAYVTVGGVNVYDRAGGLVGYNEGVVENSYALGNAYVSNYDAGGLVGYNDAGSRVSYCYASGNAYSSGNISTGGLIGYNSHSNPRPVVESSYYSGSPEQGPGESVTETEIKRRSVFAGWDFSETWTIDEGISSPQLMWEIFTWTGSGDASSWADPDNWDNKSGYPSSKEHKAFINSGSASILITPNTSLGGLQMGPGFSGTIQPNAGFVFDGSGTREGSLVILGGMFDTNDKSITVEGRFAKASGAVFTPSDGRFVMFSGEAPSLIEGSTTFKNFVCTTPGKVLTFESGSVQTIEVSLVISGEPQAHVYLTGSSETVQWRIDPTSTRAIDFAHVKGSYNIHPTSIEALTSIDGGRNTGWIFGLYEMRSTQNSGGTIEPPGVEVFPMGATASYEVRAIEDYYIPHVLIDGSPATFEGSGYLAAFAWSGPYLLRCAVTFESVSANHSIEAFFAPFGLRLWTGTGTNESWSNPDNWIGQQVPLETDTAYFTSTGTKDSTVDEGFPGTIAGINIDSGYPGTITQARSLTVTGTYEQAGGTFECTAPEQYDLTVVGDFIIPLSPRPAKPQFLRLAGAGTQGEPYIIYDIYGLQGLLGLRTEFKHYRLGRDIDGSSAVNWRRSASRATYEGFVPIGDSDNAFTGSIDGAYRSLAGLWINRGTSDNVGLIGYGRNADVLRLLISGCFVAGKEKTGAVAGFVSNEAAYALRGISVGGYVSGTTYVGGLAGESRSEVSGNYSHATVSGSTIVGGLIGIAAVPSLIRDSYSAADVSGSTVAGGLIGNSAGTSQSRIRVENCYASGPVAAGSVYGGLIGTRANTDILSSFFDRADLDNSLGTLTSEANMRSRAHFAGAGWDFARAWGIDGGKSYPYLQHQRHLWTGSGESAAWTDPGNWSLRTTPEGYSKVFINTSEAEISAPATLILGGLQLGPDFGGELLLGDVATLRSRTTLEGSLYLYGGTIKPGSGLLIIDENFFRTGSAVFSRETSTVSLESRNPSLISGSNIFYNFETYASGKIISFEAGSVNTVEGQFLATAEENDRIYLASSVPAIQWVVDPQGPRLLKYLHVSDSYNANEAVIQPKFTVDGGNNYWWEFDTVTIEATYNYGGIISPEGVSLYYKTLPATYEVTAASGHYVPVLWIDGMPATIGSAPDYSASTMLDGDNVVKWIVTFESLSSDHTIEAYFVPVALRVWSGGAGDANWSTPGNWFGDVVPGETEIAVFNSLGTGASTIDAGFAGIVRGITIESSYSGTLETGRVFTAESAGVSMEGGTFLQKGHDIHLYGDWFNASTAYAGVLNFGEGDIPSGSFSSESGAIVFAKLSGTQAIYSGVVNSVFQDITHSGQAKLTTGQMLLIMNDFVNASGSGTLELNGGSLFIGGNFTNHSYLSQEVLFDDEGELIATLNFFPVKTRNVIDAGGTGEGRFIPIIVTNGEGVLEFASSLETIGLVNESYTIDTQGYDLSVMYALTNGTPSSQFSGAVRVKAVPEVVRDALGISADASLMLGVFNIKNLVCEAPGKTILISGSITIEASGSVEFRGGTASTFENISLGVIGGTKWYIDPQCPSARRHFSNLTVGNSVNINPLRIRAVDSLDRGGNTGWIFGTYEVSASTYGSGGTVEPPSVLVATGAPATFEARAYTGYHMPLLLIDGSPATFEGVSDYSATMQYDGAYLVSCTFTFESVNADHTIEAYFAAKGSVVWTGLGSDSLWSNPDNWLAGAVPDETKVAVFSLVGSGNDSEIDAAFAGTVLGVSVESGYSGTIEVSRVFTAETAGIFMEGGSLIQKGPDIYVRGDWRLVSGSFGYFTSEGGSVIFDAPSGTQSLYTGNDYLGTLSNPRNTFYGMIHTGEGTLAVSLYEPPIVLGDMLLTGGTYESSSTLYLMGDLTNTGHFSSESMAAIAFTGEGTQTIRSGGTGSNSLLPALISNLSGTLQVDGSLEAYGLVNTGSVEAFTGDIYLSVLLALSTGEMNATVHITESPEYIRHLLPIVYGLPAGQDNFLLSSGGSLKGLSCRVPGKKIYFNGVDPVTIEAEGFVTLEGTGLGSSAEMVSLLKYPGNPAARWSFDPRTPSRQAQNVYVKDSLNINDDDILTTDSVDAGNNDGWIFDLYLLSAVSRGPGTNTPSLESYVLPGDPFTWEVSADDGAYIGYVLVDGVPATPESGYDVAFVYQDGDMKTCVVTFESISSVHSLESFFNYDGQRTWTGFGTNEMWSNPGNWSGDQVPSPEETVIFSEIGTKNSLVDELFHGTVSGISIGSGYSGIISQEAALAVAGSYSQAGGSFSSEASPLSIAGSFLRTGGAFDSGTGTVEFVSAQPALITGNTSFYRFVCAVPGKAITFESGSMQTAEAVFNVSGEAGARISLSASDAGAWNIDPIGTREVMFVSVSNSANISEESVIAAYSNDFGGNSGWVFPSYGVTAYAGLGGAVNGTVGPSELFISTFEGGSVVLVVSAESGYYTSRVLINGRQTEEALSPSPKTFIMSDIAAIQSFEAVFASTIEGKVWTGMGPTDNWSDALNWSGNTVIEPDETAVFKGEYPENSVIDAAFGGVVAGLSVEAGYTGIITQETGLSILGDHWQAGGIFVSDVSYGFAVGGSFSIPNTREAFKRFSGAGTAMSPYGISDVYGLQAMNCYKSASFELDSSIDASSTAVWNWNGSTYEGFVPVGHTADKFTGGFNGQDRIVANLYISRESTDNVGLFGRASSASIIGVGVAGIEITGRTNVGGLAGMIESGSRLTDSYSTGNVTGRILSMSGVGGLAGYLSSSVVSNCYSTANVSGPASVGGLVGYAAGGNIRMSYAAGNVSAAGNTAGGLAGEVLNSTVISDCYSTVSPQGADDVGGLVGKMYLSSVVSNSYSLGDATGTGSDVGGLVGESSGSTITSSYYSGLPDNGQGTRETEAALMQKATFTGWDFKDTWLIDEGKNFPYLTFEAWNLRPGGSWTTPSDWTKGHIVQSSYPQDADDMVYIGSGVSVSVPSVALGGLHLSTLAGTVLLGGPISLTNSGTREGALQIHGGVLDAAGYTTRLSGGFASSGSGLFTHSGGKVSFESPAASLIEGNNAFYDFNCYSPGKALSFEAGKVQTVEGAFVITGSDLAYVSLYSSSPESQWYVDPSGARYVGYASVRDSNNVSGSDIIAVNSVGIANNTGWVFSDNAVHVICGPGGTVNSQEGVFYVSTEEGGSLTFTVSAEAGYYIAEVVINGLSTDEVLVTSPKEFLIAGITGLQTLEAVFAAEGMKIWDGGGATLNWSDQFNWSGNTTPSAYDRVVFNSTSSKNSTIDAAFAGTIAGVTSESGYAGTIEASRIFTVESGGISLEGGALVQKGYDLYAGGNWFVSASAAYGWFTSEGGTVYLNGTSGTQEIYSGVTEMGGPQKSTFYDLIHSGAGDARASGIIVTLNDFVNLPGAGAFVLNDTGMKISGDFANYSAFFHNVVTIADDEGAINGNVVILFNGASGSRQSLYTGGKGPGKKLSMTGVSIGSTLALASSLEADVLYCLGTIDSAGYGIDVAVAMIDLAGGSSYGHIEFLTAPQLFRDYFGGTDAFVMQGFVSAGSASCTVPGKTFLFSGRITIEETGYATFEGSAGSPILMLRNPDDTFDENYWYIDPRCPASARSFSYLTVSDSYNADALPIRAVDSTGTNTFGWIFGLYAITSTCNSGGTIEPYGIILPESGDPATYEATADPGYYISAVFVDGVPAVSGPSYSVTYETDSRNPLRCIVSFESVSADHTVEAYFVREGYRVWSGLGVDTSWSTAGNWFRSVVPSASEAALFNEHAASGKISNINTAYGTTVGGISVEAGYAGGAIYPTHTGDNLTVNGSFVLNTGEFDSNSKNIRITGDFIRSGGAVFTPSSGRSVIFTGEAPSLIGGSTVFTGLTCTKPGKILSFEAGSTQTADILNISGEAGRPVTLESGVSGVHFGISAESRSVYFVSVKDSTNESSTVVNPSGDNLNLGNTSRWFTYYIYATAEEYGSIVPSGWRTVEITTTEPITYTITSEVGSGYYVASVEVDGSRVGGLGTTSYDFVDVRRTHTIEVLVTSDPVPTEPPAALRVNAIGSDVVLSWSVVSGPVNYRVYKSSDKFISLGSWDEAGTTEALSWTDEDISTTEAYYVVRAYTAGGEGPNSSMGAYKRISFEVNEAPTGNLNWISLPHNSAYISAASIVTSIEGGSGTTNTKIREVTKFLPGTQGYSSYFYLSGWKGTNFVIEPGEGLYIIPSGNDLEFEWAVAGVDSQTTISFEVNEAPTGNLNWISLPYTSLYTNAASIVTSIEGGSGTTNTKIREVTKFLPGTQGYSSYFYLSGWKGTNFVIEPGEGLYIIPSGNDLEFDWEPGLIIPVRE